MSKELDMKLLEAVQAMEASKVVSNKAKTEAEFKSA
jgi:hypothetical protein